MKRIRLLAAIGALLLGPALSARSQESRNVEALSVEALVQQLRSVPAVLPAAAPLDGIKRPIEIFRDEIYDRLLALSPASIRALAQGFQDPDVEFRRNVALALNVLSGKWWSFAGEARSVDLTAVLPELIGALTDADPTVRAWAAQDIGNIGAGAAAAVPALRTLLARDDEASRNSACIALRGIGPSAAAALPSLRSALSDPSANVRRFADIAIRRIENEQQ
jgi:HEAT repeat protein